MRTRLLARVKHLESLPEIAKRPDLIQVGWIFPLPPDYVGELHVVVTNRELTAPGIEWCNFEERPGPAPPNTEGLVRSERRGY